jgi:hypothetical protein
MASSEAPGFGVNRDGLVIMAGGAFWVWAGLAATVTTGYLLGLVLTEILRSPWVSWIATAFWQMVALVPWGVAPWLPGGGFLRAAENVFSSRDFEPLSVALAFIWAGSLFVGAQIWFQDRDLL